MNDLRDLYQQVILDHHKRPRNFRAIEQPTHHADGHNRLCGDKLSLYLMVHDGVIADVSFQGSGCAISTASASLLTEAIKGKTVAEAEALFGKFHDVLTGPPGEPLSDDESLGKLAVFAGVREFPVRVKCATLAWHTLHAALGRGNEAVSTE